MLLFPCPISSKRFTFTENTFVTEASDIRPHYPFDRVYDDAADVGFSIVSAKTGNSVVFRHKHTHQDSEGDIVKWEFECVSPNWKHLKAEIFND